MFRYHFDLPVVCDEHVDVVPEDRRQREVSLVGNFAERLELVLAHAKGDRLVFAH